MRRTVANLSQLSCEFSLVCLHFSFVMAHHESADFIVNLSNYVILHGCKLQKQDGICFQRNKRWGQKFKRGFSKHSPKMAAWKILTHWCGINLFTLRDFILGISVLWASILFQFILSKENKEKTILVSSGIFYLINYFLNIPID